MRFVVERVRAVVNSLVGVTSSHWDIVFGLTAVSSAVGYFYYHHSMKKDVPPPEQPPRYNTRSARKAVEEEAWEKSTAIKDFG